MFESLEIFTKSLLTEWVYCSAAYYAREHDFSHWKLMMFVTQQEEWTVYGLMLHAFGSWPTGSLEVVKCDIPPPTGRLQIYPMHHFLFSWQMSRLANM